MSDRSNTTKTPVINFKEEDAVALKAELLSEAPEAGINIVSAVRQARRISGLTQAEYAAATGVSLPTLSSIERGKGSPTLATINALLLPVGLQLGVVQATQNDTIITGRPWRRPNIQITDREVNRRISSAQLKFDGPRKSLTVQKKRQVSDAENYRVKTGKS